MLHSANTVTSNPILNQTCICVAFSFVRRDNFLSRTQQHLLAVAMRSVGQYEAAVSTLQRRCEQQLAYEEQRMAAMAAANARRRLEAERQRVELKQRSQLDRLAARMQVSEPFPGYLLHGSCASCVVGCPLVRLSTP